MVIEETAARWLLETIGGFLDPAVNDHDGFTDKVIDRFHTLGSCWAPGQ